MAVLSALPQLDSASACILSLLSDVYGRPTLHFLHLAGPPEVNSGCQLKHGRGRKHGRCHVQRQPRVLRDPAGWGQDGRHLCCTGL